MTRQPRRPETTPQPGNINGVDTEELFSKIDMLKENPQMAQSHWQAKTTWQGGSVSETHVTSWALGGEENPQDFTIKIDEPVELLGSGQAPNPQQVLMAAINSCILNTYVVNAAVRGVHLESLEIDIEGDIDLRGYLGIDESITKGYEEINYTVRVRGDGTREQFEEIHEAATSHSPNFYTVTHPVPINGRLVIE